MTLYYACLQRQIGRKPLEEQMGVFILEGIHFTRENVIRMKVVPALQIQWVLTRWMAIALLVALI
jgi:hypothetical protein